MKPSPLKKTASLCSPGRLAAGMLLTGSLLGTPSPAHAPPQDRLNTLSAQIGPGSPPALFLLRADLHRQSGEFALALADLERAESLGAPRDSLALVRAAVHLDQGRADAAADLLRPLADSALGGIHLLAARIASRRADSEGELRALERALRLDPRLDPEVHRRRAELLLVRVPPDLHRALAAAEFGLATLDDVPALIFLASDIEAELGRPESALRRLDRLEPHLQGTPFLLARRGDLLRRAGRELEAEVAYTEALVALEERRTAHRDVPADARLEAELRAALRSGSLSR